MVSVSVLVIFKVSVSAEMSVHIPAEMSVKEGVQVLRSTGHSLTIGIEEKNFDEYEKLQSSTRI